MEELQSSLKDRFRDDDGFDPRFIECSNGSNSSGIGSDLGSDSCSVIIDTGPVERTGRIYHDSGVFSRRDSNGSDLNSVPSVSSVANDHNYFAKKTAFTEDLKDGWKRISVQRLTGVSVGKWDRYLIGPDGQKLRSNVQLRNYLNENSIEVDKNVINFHVDAVELQNPPRQKRPKPLLVNFTFSNSPFSGSGSFPFRFSSEDKLTAIRARKGKRKKDLPQDSGTPSNNFVVIGSPPKKAKLPKPAKDATQQAKKSCCKRNLGNKPSTKGKQLTGSKPAMKTDRNSNLTSMKNSFNIFNNFSSFITDSNQPATDSPNQTNIDNSVDSETPLHQRCKRSTKSSKKPSTKSFKTLSTKNESAQSVDFSIGTEENLQVDPVLTSKKVRQGARKTKPKEADNNKARQETKIGRKTWSKKSSKASKSQGPKLVPDPWSVINFNDFDDSIFCNGDDPMSGRNSSNSLEIYEINSSSPIVSNRIIVSTGSVSIPSGVCSFCGIGQPANHPATELLNYCLFCCEPHHQSCMEGVTEVLSSSSSFDSMSLLPCGSVLTSL